MNETLCSLGAAFIVARTESERVGAGQYHLGSVRLVSKSFSNLNNMILFSPYYRAIFKILKNATMY